MAILKRKKKTVKPTATEQKTITRRLQKKYPQMYKSVWPAGVYKKWEKLPPTDRKIMESMVGGELKKKYKRKRKK